jgi:hypothetical protein
MFNLFKGNFIMSDPLHESYQRLLIAANSLLSNAADLGDCFVDEENDDVDYPKDEDGNRWYHDWFELNAAVEHCNSLNTSPVKLEVTRQALEAGEIIHTGWTFPGLTAKRWVAENPEVPYGVTVRKYFDATGKFLGADASGLEPTFKKAKPVLADEQ